MSKGILIVNLGSPDDTSKKSVKRYLREFLMDKRVIDIPIISRFLLVRGIILNTRPKKSAAAYEKIWWKEGSPLVVLTNRLAEKIRAKIDVPLAVGMRYGSLSIKKGLQKLSKQGVDEVLMIPLYPQYAMSTTETVIEKTRDVRNKYFPNMKVDVFPPFYKDKNYIKVLAESLKSEMGTDISAHLIFSYHGVPERHIYKSDITKSHCKIDGNCCVQDSPAHDYCYRHQCFTTTQLVVEELGVEKENYSNTFQSRLGRSEWLKPYTSEFLVEIANTKKNVTIVSPAFVADCLETLEELGMENKEVFMEAGGEKYTLLSCLNDKDEWADLLAKWSKEWLESDTKKEFLELN
jgi:ferrochelatase